MADDTGSPMALAGAHRAEIIDEAIVERMDTAPSFSSQHPMANFDDFEPLDQRQIDWLLERGVTTTSMIRPEPVLVARGSRANDGIFETDPEGERWLVFRELDDAVCWNPRSGELATCLGRAFALGEELIDDAFYLGMTRCLNIFADPLDWLRAQRHGLVILDWRRAFDRLRDVPRIAIDERVRPMYDRHMKPPRLPKVITFSAENPHGS